MNREEIKSGVLFALQRGEITPDEVLAELYADIQEVKAFTGEFRTVLAVMQNGKMGGLLGKLMGGKRDAVQETEQESLPQSIGQDVQPQTS